MHGLNRNELRKDVHASELPENGLFIAGRVVDPECVFRVVSACKKQS